MKKIIDIYLIIPILLDYLIGIIIIISAYVLNKKYCIIEILKIDFSNLLDTISDLVTISLTFAGFILTVLTILITFKSTSNTSKTSSIDNSSVFNLFFASSLYKQTIEYLKSSIVSLSFISIVGFFCKLFLNESQIQFLLAYCILGIIVLVLTVTRNLLIISRVLKLQDD